MCLTIAVELSVKAKTWNCGQWCWSWIKACCWKALQTSPKNEWKYPAATMFQGWNKMAETAKNTSFQVRTPSLLPNTTSVPTKPFYPSTLVKELFRARLDRIELIPTTTCVFQDCSHFMPYNNNRRWTLRVCSLSSDEVLLPRDQGTWPRTSMHLA